MIEKYEGKPGKIIMFDEAWLHFGIRSGQGKTYSVTKSNVIEQYQSHKNKKMTLEGLKHDKV